ncbi:MAG: MlaD family protein [Verrucomicrobiota bacterium]|nr:MlaD family protein [Verrucomicrobiota bacterium]
MQINKNEITTGLLVLITFTVLIGLLILIGMPGLLKPLNTYRIYYDNANGIRPGAPVLLAGREIGKVTALNSPIPQDKRPEGHSDFEVSIDVQVDRDAEIYNNVTVRLTQQGLMGQQVIDFIQGDASTGIVKDKAEFIGKRVPDLSEAITDNMKRLTGPGSDFALTLENIKNFTGADSDLVHTVNEVDTFMKSLNKSNIPKVIQNTEQFTDTLKREPWRLIWPSTKEYKDDKKKPAETVTRKKQSR